MSALRLLAVRPRLARALLAGSAIALGAALVAVRSDPARAAEPAAGAAPAAVEHPLSDVVFDAASGLGAGWSDIGWAKHTLPKGAPAQVDFSGQGGWILSHAELEKPPGGLVVRFRAPAAYGDFLEVRLDGRPGQRFPRVRLERALLHDAGDGFREAWIDGAQLDPLGKPFSQVVLLAIRAVESKPVELARIAFTAPRVVEAPPAPSLAPESFDAQLDCAKSHPISPSIYGAGLGGDENRWDAGATVRRWGGNTATTYNWELGNAWNTGRDWFFRNVPVNPTAQQFIEEGMAHGVPTMLTVPIIGAVANDTTSCSFPVSVFGEQQAVAPDLPDCGNGVAKGGAPIPAGAASTGAAAPPEFVARWVRALRAADQKRSSRSIRGYILDNEPMLWHINHRDLHPQPVSYDELLDRTVRYATAIRRADPEAIISGPALWGWTALQFSAADGANGQHFIPKDRLAHGNKPLLPWWLEAVRAHEKKEGIHLLDLVDVHFYPQTPGLGLYTDGWTDSSTSARRIRSVRALWDPTYKDESWIGEPVKLIPRLREWIDANAPGVGISIGEYNFGAENHISGGLAVAEALGRFGQQGISSAYYWAYPPHGSAAEQAFRAYRNYDGAGARFLDTSIDVKTSGQPLASLFASRDEKGEKLVAVVLNEDLMSPLLATVDGASCGGLTVKRVFTYRGEGGLTEAKPLEAPGAQLLFPPASINVVEYSVAPAKR